MKTVDKYLREIFDVNATHIHNEIERSLKKYFGKKAKITSSGLKAGKSKLVVNIAGNNYLITVDPK